MEGAASLGCLCVVQGSRRSRYRSDARPCGIGCRVTETRLLPLDAVAGGFRAIPRRLMANGVGALGAAREGVEGVVKRASPCGAMAVGYRVMGGEVTP